MMVSRIQWTGSWPAVRDWLTKLAGGGFAFAPGTSPPIWINMADADRPTLTVRTPTGPTPVEHGQWIVKHEDGTFTIEEEGER